MYLFVSSFDEDRIKRKRGWVPGLVPSMGVSTQLQIIYIQGNTARKEIHICDLVYVMQYLR